MRVAANVMEYVTGVFEGAGVLVIIGGFVLAIVKALLGRRHGADMYTVVRNAFGRSVLLGLEILVAADLIRTVTVTPTLDSVLVLGLLVLIRTFLSFSFEIELEGVLPWRRSQLEHETGETV